MSNSYTCKVGGLEYAGTHLLLDIWGAKHLDDERRIRETLVKAVNDCGATLLEVSLHVYSPNNGISGVAILAESHMSIHTWPELGYAAVDIFVCGSVDPYKSLPAIREGFEPDKLNVFEVKRGIV